MTRKELVDSINFGCDIMFDCRGKHYTILGWCPGGPNIAEQITEANEMQFDNGDDLVDHYMIDGKPMINWLDQIDITFSS